MRRGWNPRRLSIALGALIGLAAALPPASAAADGVGIVVAKTVDSSAIAPVLSQTFAVDRTNAVPADTLTYSGQVGNTLTNMVLSGHITAENPSSAVSTVASYFDQFEACTANCSTDHATWRALAGFGAAIAGYTPAANPTVTTGLTLAATPTASSGVTYPATGDRILGTQFGVQTVGGWNYQATVAL